MAPDLSDRAAEARAARAGSQEAMRAKIRAMREAKQEAQAAASLSTPSSSRGSIVAAAAAAVGAAPSSRTPSDLAPHRSQLGVAQLGVPQRLGVGDRLSQIDPRHLSWYAEEEDGEDESTVHGHNRAEAAAAAAEEAAEAAAVAAMTSARTNIPSGAVVAPPSSRVRTRSRSRSPELGRASTDTRASYSSGSTGAFADSSRPATSMSSGSSRPNTALSSGSRRASGKISRKQAADVLEGLEAELRAQRAGSPQQQRSGPPPMALPELPPGVLDAKRRSSSAASASASASASTSSLGRYKASTNPSEVSLAASQSSSAGSLGRTGWSSASPLGGPPDEPLPTLPNSPSSASAGGGYGSVSRRTSVASRTNAGTSSSLRSTPSPAPSSGAISPASLNRGSFSSAYSSGSSARGGASAATPATTADDLSRKARHSGAPSVSSFAPSDASIEEETLAHPNGSGGTNSSDEALSDVLHLPVTQASMSFFQAMMPTVAPSSRIGARQAHKEGGGSGSGSRSMDEDERRRRSLMHKSIGGLAAALGDEADQWASMPNSPMSYVPSMSDYRPSFDSMRESIDEGHSSHTAHGVPPTAPLAVRAGLDRSNLSPSPSMTDDRRASTATHIVQLYAGSIHDGESPSRGNTPQPGDGESSALPPKTPPKDAHFVQQQRMTPSSSTSSSTTAPTISARDSSMRTAHARNATSSTSTFAPTHATTPSISISIDEAASGSEDSDDLSSEEDGPRKRRKQKGKKGRKGWGFEEQRAAPSRVTPGSTAFPAGVVPTTATAVAAQGGNDPWAFYQFSPDLPPFVGPGLRPMDLTGRGTWRAIATRGLGVGPGLAPGLSSGLMSARSSTLTLGHQSEAGSVASASTAGPVSMRQVAAQARANLERANTAIQRQRTLLSQRSFQPVDIHEHASSHQSVILDPSSHSIFSFDSSVRVGDADTGSVYADTDFTLSRSVSMHGSIRSSKVMSEAGTDMRSEPTPTKQYAVMATQTSPTSSPEATPTSSPRLRSTAVGTGADDDVDTAEEVDGAESAKQRRRETAQMPDGLARPQLVWSDDEDAAAGGEVRAPTPNARNGGKPLAGRKSMPLVRHRRSTSASSTDLDDPALWTQSLRAPRLTSRKSIAGFRASQKGGRGMRASLSGNQSESTIGPLSELESAMESDGDGSDDDDASSSGASDESDLDLSTPLELLAERSGALDPSRQRVARGEKRKLRQKGSAGAGSAIISGPRKIAPAPRSRLNGASALSPAKAPASSKAGWSSAEEDRAETPQRRTSSKASLLAKSPTPTPTSVKSSFLAAPASASRASASSRVGLGIRKSQSMAVMALRRRADDSSDDDADLLSIADAHDESLLESELDLPSLDDDDFMPSPSPAKLTSSQRSSTQSRGSLKFPTPPRRISPPVAARSSAGSSVARSSGGHSAASVLLPPLQERPMSVELQPSPDAGQSDKFEDTPSTQAGSELWTSIGDRASIATTISETSSDGAISGEAVSSLAHAESLEASTGHSNGHSHTAPARDSRGSSTVHQEALKESGSKPPAPEAAVEELKQADIEQPKETAGDEAPVEQADKPDSIEASTPSEPAVSPRSSVASPTTIPRSALPTPRKSVSALPQPRTPVRPRLSKANLSEAANFERSALPTLTPRQSTLPRPTTPASSAAEATPAKATPSRLPAPGGLRRMKSSGDLPRPSLVIPNAATMPSTKSQSPSPSPALRKSPSPIPASPSSAGSPSTAAVAGASGLKPPISVSRTGIPRSSSSLSIASVASSGIPRSSLGGGSGSSIPRRSPSHAALGAAAGANNRSMRANVQ